MKRRQIISISVLVVMILIRSIDKTGLVFELLDLTINLVAAYVLFSFYHFIKPKFSNKVNLRYPIWLLIYSFGIGGVIMFIDSVLLNDMLVNSAVLGQFFTISLLSMLVGIIWFGILLMKNSIFQAIGIGFILSIVAFIIIHVANSNQKPVLIIIGQVINAAPYLLILRYYLSLKEIKTTANN